MQRYAVDGQIYAADDGILIRLPDGDGRIDIASLIAFDPDDIHRIGEAQVSGSVRFAARFRDCAARALFMPRTDPGKRVRHWHQRLRAAQFLSAVRARQGVGSLGGERYEGGDGVMRVVAQLEGV